MPRAIASLPLIIRKAIALCPQSVTCRRHVLIDPAVCPNSA